MAVKGYRELPDVPNQLKFTVADPEGREIGFVKDSDLIDMDLGDTNDFEIQFGTGVWEEKKYDWNHRIYIPDTEYGGLLEERKTSTSADMITWSGYTWRGLLGQKIIQPPSGKSHLIVSGDANTIIKDVIGNRFGSLFVADADESGIKISNYQFDRYCTVLAGLEKMLAAKNARLKIYYVQGTPGTAGGAVHVCAVPVTDWSEELEYSQDGKMDFTTKDFRRGTNHLICTGEGENEERLVLHLYVQKDGSIGDTKYYTGLKEREAVYDFTSADMTELKEGGTERLLELMNYKQMEADVSGMDIDIWDIVGGRDRVTGMTLQKPVVGKILKIQDGTVSVEYKLKGAE